MEVRIATPQEIAKLSKLSVSLGNVPFLADQAIVAVLEHDAEKPAKGEPNQGQSEKEIVGFAAVQNAMHAAGSWVAEKHRRQKHSYELRQCLDNELRRRGFAVYFALPGNDFEKHLFAKYGAVTEQVAQIRHL
jgi:hypothetical protein